ncbi:MAG: hypothetical protein A2W99_12075 [Bacteroidetes bacterium GWF2_33_16]|nr:MAG: hypothetical protein A2X00_02200 [Bacteroidetes bacterium GWE2_32_14]OFY06435.1 MAG: hypothetical protein A2W99_12075 [Bacteroidetes bacterium GWF2_33_16]
MKTKFLFPNRFKRIGWILLIPAAILGFFILFFDFEFMFLDSKVFAIYSEMFALGGSNTKILSIDVNNITDEIVSILFLIGAIFVAFSKEKQEDEFIAKVRLESLVWATYINYAILIFCIMFFFSTGFLTVMILNMFTILIFFIIRFYYILYSTNKSLDHEK